MQRSNVADMRQAMETADMMKRAGILFVPIPVLNNSDHANLIGALKNRLEKIEKDAFIEECRLKLNEIQKNQKGD